jgi:heat shock protein HslJ
MAPSPHRARAALSFGLLALVVVAPVVVAGCGDDDDDDDAVSAADLEGRTFAANETDGHTIVEGSRITITFSADDMLAVETGCNTLTGSYTIDGDVLTTGEMAQTLMACEEALSAQEQWINDLLASNPTIELEGSELELSSGDNSISFDESS